ncbi:acyl carrier protein [Mailhella massiliensis]|uniref:acyl carrier protein n=1 Tax=Mailhella massiliensis TaxID=1903261 RepID=UPI00097DCF60|nr:acyl carrier protein [Mailhella massiliensis]
MSVESRINELIAAHFSVGTQSIRPQTDFYTDLEADVLDLPELAMEMETEFAVALDSRVLEGVKTVEDLVNHVHDRLEIRRQELALAFFEAKARVDAAMAVHCPGGRCE